MGGSTRIPNKMLHTQKGLRGWLLVLTRDAALRGAGEQADGWQHTLTSDAAHRKDRRVGGSMKGAGALARYFSKQALGAG